MINTLADLTYRQRCILRELAEHAYYAGRKGYSKRTPSGGYENLSWTKLNPLHAGGLIASAMINGRKQCILTEKGERLLREFLRMKAPARQLVNADGQYELNYWLK